MDLPVLENERIRLLPLEADDFDALYAVAADPAIWAQHPNKNRWQKPVFQNFFIGALQSKGAYKIIDKSQQKIAGSTRIYDYDPKNKHVLIGYTFFATEYWGSGFNPAVKTMLLDYLFGFVDTVGFHIGAENIRSQIAITRLGAIKTGEQEIAYFGEDPKLNYIYHIDKKTWLTRGA